MKLILDGEQGIGETSILELLWEIYPNRTKRIFGDYYTKRMGAMASNSKKKYYT